MNILEKSKFVPDEKVSLIVWDQPDQVIHGVIDRDSNGILFIQCDDGIAYYPDQRDTIEYK